MADGKTLLKSAPIHSTQEKQHEQIASSTSAFATESVDLTSMSESRDLAASVFEADTVPLEASIEVPHDSIEADSEIVIIQSPIDILRDSLSGLSASALKKRNRILKSLRTHSVDTSVFTEQQSALDILQSDLVTDQSILSIEAVKEIAPVFETFKSTVSSDLVCSRKQKALKLYNFLKPYELDINMYLTKHSGRDALERIKSKSPAIFDMIFTYNQLQSFYDADASTMTADNENALYDEIGLERSKLEQLAPAFDLKKVMAIKAERADKKRESHTKDTAAAEIAAYETAYNEETTKEAAENEQMDSTLNDVALDSVEKIDKWILKRANYGSTNDAFVSRLMEMSKRERLFIYSLITECDLEKPLNPLEIFSAMNSDEINLSRFNSNMRANRLKVWRYAGNNHILWEKLELGMQIARDYRKELITNSRSIDESDISDSIIDEQTKADYKALSTEEKEAINTVLAQLQSTDEELKEKIDEANGIAANLQADIDQCNALIKARDEASCFTKKAKTANANAKVQLTMITFQRLLQKQQEVHTMSIDKLSNRDDLSANAKAVLARMNVPKNDKLIDSGTDKAFEDDGTTLANTLWGTGLMLAASTKLTAYGNLNAGSKTDYKMTDYSTIRGIAYATGGVALAGGLLGTLNAIKAFNVMLKDWGKNGILDNALNAGKFANASLGAMWGISSGITTMCYADKMASLTKISGEALKSTKAAVDTMKTGTAIAGVAVSGASLLYNCADLAVQYRHGSLLNDAQAIITAKNSGANAYKGSDRDYAQNLLALQKRNLRLAKATAWINTASAVTTTALSASALFVSGGLAAALLPTISAGVAGLTTITTKLVTYFGKKSIRKSSYEDFLKVTDFSEELEYMGLGQTAEAKKLTQDTKFKERALNEMIAHLGFGSLKTFFKHSCLKMAEFAHNHLFYFNGNPAAPVLSSSRKTDEVLAWESYCKSLGLKVVFPDSISNADKRKPAPSVIAQKLIG